MSEPITAEPCRVRWGSHDFEHQCSLSLDEHGESPQWHECDCGSMHEDREPA